MKEKMVSFLNSIGIENFNDFDIDFDMVSRDRFNRNQINMVIVKHTPWEYHLIRQFQDAITTVDYTCSIMFSYIQKPTFDNVDLLFKDWYQTIYRMPAPISFAKGEDGNCVFVEYSSESEKEKYSDVFKDFRDFLKFINYEFTISENIKVTDDVVKVDKKTMKLIEKAASEIADATIEETKDERDENYRNDVETKIEEERTKLTLQVEESMMDIMIRNKKTMDQERERARRNKRGNYLPVEAIKDITDKSGNVDFSGTVHKIDSKTYAGITRLTVGVHDDNGDAINVSLVENQQVDTDFIKNLKIKTNLRIRGCAYVDDYSKQLSIKGHYVNFLPPEEIPIDDAPIKRVELHLHSTMSNQDGVTSMNDYCAYASKIGHTCLSVTDHGVVQAFPDAQNAAKANNIKMLYGCEFYMVDDELKYIINPCKTLLKSATYVVFDLETTGLNSRYDKITEFGAIKAQRGSAQASIDILINPERKLSHKISTLTDITDEMLEGQPTIKDVLPQILEFIGDSILVSHNAQFDVSFLNQALIDNGYPPLKNAVVDTLPLSRYLFPDSRSHSLGSLCHNMEIKYDEESAHRAVYDATVLNNVWQPMLDGLLNKKPNLVHEELASLVTPPTLFKKLRPTHIIVFAKNKAGLKDLYRLVSMAHIDYFAETPRIPKRILAQYRKNLIFGSACLNGEVFDAARNSNLEKIMDVMSFYDYIEVQPPENYSILVNLEELTEDEILRTLKDVVEAADKLGKPVCATGDVHYLTPKEKIFRDVYIAAQAVGGVYHPLNSYGRRKNGLKFDNPNQHFRNTKEMLECFSFLPEEKAYEIVVTNTNKIADSIDVIMPAPNDTLYKPHIDNCQENLVKMCYDNAKALYGDPLPELIQKRLDRELDGITSNGYSVVYYIAHLIVKKTTDDGYIVGSRGSVGSSFVATMSGITEVNPLPPHYVCPKCKKVIWGKDIHPDCKSGYDLPLMKCPDCGEEMKSDGQNIPFETFLGFEANKVPDIDLNFPGDYRDRAYDFTKEQLGPENCFRAGTIGTVAEKTAFGFAKGFFENPLVADYRKKGLTEEEAKAKAKKEIDENIPKAKLDYIASGCVDVRRTTGQHPGGIVVVPRDHDIYDFCPIQYPADDSDEGKNWKTTHFDFEKIHDTLLKLDMLGHDDPIALKMMCDLTGIKITDIPLNDSDVISLFYSSKALNLKRDYLANKTGAMGLPEFGTENTRRILEITTPHCFNDLIIISGLSHGTGVWAGNAEELIKTNTATLQSVIGCRDDIMTYLMSMGIDPKVSFTIMETVRKKDKFLKPEQIEIMKAKGIPQFYIDSCNKIEYLFPKGHATAYCIMAVRVGYFKVHYPLEFYATFFTVRSEQFEIDTMIKGEEEIIKRLDALKLRARSKIDKLSTKEEGIYKTLQVALEMLERGYYFANIDLYKSDYHAFVVDREHGCIIPPFRTIDGLGENNAISVIEEREKGPFTCIKDLLRRTKLTQTNVGDLKKLGVLDNLNEDDQLTLFDF